MEAKPYEEWPDQFTSTLHHYVCNPGDGLSGLQNEITQQQNDQIHEKREEQATQTHHSSEETPMK